MKNLIDIKNTQIVMNGIYKNKKNGKLYFLSNIGLDVTKNRDEEMIHYRPMYKCKYTSFFREANEFKEKFIFVGHQGESKETLLRRSAQIDIMLMAEELEEANN